MWEIFNKQSGARRTWRPAALVASAAVVAMAVTACGGGGGGSNSGSSSGGSSGGSSAAAQASCGRSSTDPYPGVKAAEAPQVTASNAKLPSGTPGKGKPAVKMGSKNFSESTLVAQLYGQALAKKGFTVQYQPQIGASETIDKAFQSNQIDMYPEYLGEIASSIAQKSPQETSTARKTYDVAKQFEQSQRGATIFKQTPYQDVDIMLVTPQFCKQHKLKSAADLVNVGNKGSGVTFTAQGAARTRYSGFKGLQEAYGLTNAKFKGAPTGGSTLQVVKGGGANVADGFSTTTSVVQAVKKGEFVVLKDPKHIMGFQHVAPIVKQSLAKKEGPAFEQTLNWVSSKLTLNAINAMNKAVQLNHQPEETVAKTFLTQNGLK